MPGITLARGRCLERRSRYWTRIASGKQMMKYMKVAVRGNKVVRVVHKVAAGDERQDGAVLNQVERLVAQRRQDDLERLGQDHVAVRLHAGEALRQRRFHLSTRNCFDTGADDLGDVCRVVQAHAHEAQDKRGNAHGHGGAGDGLQDLRAGHVHEEHLHRQRGVLVELNVHAADCAQDARARGGEHAQDGSQHKGEQQAGDDHLQGKGKALPQRTAFGQRQLPSCGIEESL